MKPMTVLDTRALNRATLARQLLLDRADMPVRAAVAEEGWSLASFLSDGDSDRVRIDASLP
ncbi:hypothetical protein [Planomonospora algeriensis]